MNQSTYLKVKDHSVSGEEFQLILNEDLQMLETFPKPTEEKLSQYYKSEDYISHTDSKRNVFEYAYHIIRSRALRNKLKLINSFDTEAKDLLDIGCGTGDFLRTAQNSGWSITGIEPNVQARTIANDKTGNKVFEAEQLLSIEENSFDVITLWHVLEHLPKLETHISLFKNLLKPNGFLVVAVPNFKSYDAQHYKSFWAAYDVPRHLWHFSRQSIKHLFGKFGFTVVSTRPMIFDSFYVSLLSEKYKSDFMNPIKAFWIGLLSNIKARDSKEYSSLIYIIKKTSTLSLAL
ncbi:class I SAM-dependent methyltransferase [Winogradskyella alexanderae]|uniref:Class I SAM-dependent methyltransferase n=1 Tax=Winogradskyella alexanderae TaxID=2877123 RepID=A0ABS7XMN6_9FLAO|nr:class I SAM-dependent methyltransferase [Winogradskyella alexanderae]MCA0131275.1 class I SAM-dependent methyltransferase [Winogradskyella alexanderae]